MEALSLDLRERICAACDESVETRQEVAERFGVSRSFVQKLLRRHKHSGSLVAKPRAGGVKPLMKDQDLKRLRGLVSARPDSTLAELCRQLAASGGPTSRPTVSLSPTPDRPTWSVTGSGSAATPRAAETASS